MQINSVELKLDLFNADFADKYEKCARELEAGFKKTPEDSLAKGIIWQIEQIRTFVDKLFGNGIYDSLKVNSKDLDENMEIINLIRSEEIRLTEEFTKKYSSARLIRK